MNNIFVSYIRIGLSAILTLTLIPQAIAQEKLMIFVHCFDCPSDSEYLLKVFELANNPKLIGEKKFITPSFNIKNIK